MKFCQRQKRLSFLSLSWRIVIVVAVCRTAVAKAVKSVSGQNSAKWQIGFDSTDFDENFFSYTTKFWREKNP